jgi:hypothetical protein
MALSSCACGTGAHEKGDPQVAFMGAKPVSGNAFLAGREAQASQQSQTDQRE